MKTYDCRVNRFKVFKNIDPQITLMSQIFKKRKSS